MGPEKRRNVLSRAHIASQWLVRGAIHHGGGLWCLGSGSVIGCPWTSPTALFPYEMWVVILYVPHRFALKEKGLCDMNSTS